MKLGICLLWYAAGIIVGYGMRCAIEMQYPPAVEHVPTPIVVRIDADGQPHLVKPEE